MNNKVFIDLDKNETLPQLTPFQGLVNIKKNGRIIIRNSILENIDMIQEDELIYILKNLKQYISPIVTSSYIPKTRTMQILSKLAPDFKVRLKTEKAGTKQIIPMSCKEFFEGEKIFEGILSGIKNEWTDLLKYKYLYNKVCQMLSYDISTLTYGQYSGMHEECAKNIFKAMYLNWGICASFAASLDYLCYRENLQSTVLSEVEHDYVMLEPVSTENLLADPTQDSVRMKFGMKSKNFGLSKEKFIKNGHDLKMAEADNYSYRELDEDEIRKLDEQIGYLAEFGGEYTDEHIKELANSLEGDNNSEKVENILNRVRCLKTIGRPSTYDYLAIIKYIISVSNDKEFASSLKIYSFVSENTPQLIRKIAIEVSEKDGTTKYYKLENGLQSYERVNKINDIKQYNEKYL